MQHSEKPLPVASALPALKAALAQSPAVILTAETGSGKTTWLPLQLLAEPWLEGQKIVMLEPRRVAARAAAARLAYHLGEKPGKTVGYSVRFDSKTSRETRLEVVTEGILARRLANDPELAGCGLVIFDEFHERHLETDLALALTLESRNTFRADLKILVMSATIDTAQVANFLRQALGSNGDFAPIPIINSAGSNYPVAIHYHNERIDSANRAMALACARKAIELAAKHVGDFLVFLPGVAEIFAAVEFLEQFQLPDTLILPLYGEMPSAEQDRVLAPGMPGKRRIIVATPIAESSLTIEGVTVVIDSGLVRQPVFDAGTGLSHLETVPITQDSAVQRAGRAGRLGPGFCYRMYAEAEFRRRPKTRTPEILRSDLADVLLRSLAFGAHLRNLPLPDRPSSALLLQAESLLVELGLLDRTGQLTEQGKHAALIPLPPRLAAMLAAMPAQDAALLAAMLSERFTSEENFTDLAEQFTALKAFLQSGKSFAQKDFRNMAALRHAFARLRPFCRAENNFSLAQAILIAYPDRVAIKREAGFFVMVNGQGVYVDKEDPLAEAEFLVVVDIRFEKTNSAKNARLLLGLSVPRAMVLAHFAGKITTRQEIREINGRPRAYEQSVLGSLVLSEKEIALPEGFAEKLLLQKLQNESLEKFLGEESHSLIARTSLMRSLGAELPDFSLPSLQKTLEVWLYPFIVGENSTDRITDTLIATALRAQLSYAQKKLLDENLPEKLLLPSGSAHRIRYSAEQAIVSVRIQEVFGLDQHPVLAQGHLPVTLELLSPARQPIATTKNLPAFWQNVYAEVRKELRGQYPKHFWPEDPLSMQGTTQTKKAFDRKAKAARR